MSISRGRSYRATVMDGCSVDKLTNEDGLDHFVVALFQERSETRNYQLRYDRSPGKL